jgi:arylformamidase
MGHSAGGQLVSQLLNCDWPAVSSSLPRHLIRKALSISGLFDMEPLMHTPFLQTDLRLTPEQVSQTSPAWQPAPPEGHLYAVVGGDESAEFLRQNRLIRQVWGKGAVPICESLPGLNHFSVLAALCESGHRLNELAWALIKLEA